MILRSWVFDIVGDGIVIAMFSNSSSKVAARPCLASPQLLFHFGTTPEYLSCGKAFYDRYEFGYALDRNRLPQEMQMILICANLQELQLVSLLYVQIRFLQNIVYVTII